MAATELPNNETVLVLTTDGELLPLSTAGLGISSGRKSRVLSVFQGALLIHRDGRVERIDRIDFLGYYGRSVWGRIFSFANGGIRAVYVHLCEQPGVKFNEVKERVVRALGKNGAQRGLLLNDERPVEAVFRRVDEAGSAGELFEALQIPAPEDALDVLSPGHNTG